MSRRHAAIVTGHSRGFGDAIARHLLARDIAVLGIARSANDDLAREYPDTLTQVRLDLSDTAGMLQWLSGDSLTQHVHNAERAYLVNNAGLLQPLGQMSAQDIELVARALTVNVTAAVVLSAAFTQATERCPDRRILHISSGAGRHVYAGWSVYCASKAALDHHARAVQVDRTPGLRIGAVAPGVIDTDMQAEIRASSDEAVPDRHRFVQMKREGTLLSTAEAARRTVDSLLSDEFGTEPVY